MLCWTMLLYFTIFIFIICCCIMTSRNCQIDSVILSSNFNHKYKWVQLESGDCNRPRQTCACYRAVTRNLRISEMNSVEGEWTKVEPIDHSNETKLKSMFKVVSYFCLSYRPTLFRINRFIFWTYIW